MNRTINNKKSSNNSGLGFVVTNAGVLGLLQDSGRYGAFNLGLTNGGPADAIAFTWANRLCGNDLNSTAIEISLGGLHLTVQRDTIIAVTGAPMPLSVNGKPQALWHSFKVKAGDNIAFGFAPQGVRCYLAVAGGFTVNTRFGSTATVCRESVGGLDGGKLKVNDVLPCQAINSISGIDRTGTDNGNQNKQLLMLPESKQPVYSNELVLRTLLSYQHRHFSPITKRLFFSSEYQVSESWDRMGYRLQGRAVKSDLNGILSEGICYGAVQIPSDGQPIILLNDRQTIGGYAKIGAVISADCAKLAQLRQGDKLHFEPISMSKADNLFHLNSSLFKQTQLIRY